MESASPACSMRTRVAMSFTFTMWTSRNGTGFVAAPWYLSLRSRMISWFALHTRSLKGPVETSWSWHVLLYRSVDAHRPEVWYELGAGSMIDPTVNAIVEMNAGYGITRWNCTFNCVAPSGQVTESWIASSRSFLGVLALSLMPPVRDWSRIQAGPSAKLITRTRSIENSTAPQFTALPEENLTPDFSVKL